MRMRLIFALALLSLMLVAPAMAQDTATQTTPEPQTEQDDARFWFGSYGRVTPATNLDGGRGRQPLVSWPAPRTDESSYAEIEFGYQPYRDANGVEVDTIFTLALGDDFFHFNQQFGSTIAVRNLYAEARNLFIDGSFVWMGSRMYRGDDIYLMDFWPLDNLNTFGGGLGWRHEGTTARAPRRRQPARERVPIPNHQRLRPFRDWRRRGGLPRSPTLR